VLSVVESDIYAINEQSQALLDICEEALAATDGGTPTNSFIDASPPAIDCCPMLSVVALPIDEDVTSPLSPAPSTALRTTFGNVIRVTYTITALRCAAVPQKNGDPPTPAEKTAVALLVQQDGWALWNGVRHAVANGLFGDLCLGVYFDPVRYMPAEGGCVGVTFSVRAQLNGIPNDGSTLL
jgi:hypothetical protein